MFKRFRNKSPLAKCLKTQALANAGDTQAMIKLLEIYQQQQLPATEEQIKELRVKLADHEHLPSLLYLAREADRQAPSSPKMALHYYQIAAKLGDPEAAYRSGYILSTGHTQYGLDHDIQDYGAQAVSCNEQTALQYFTQAAKQQHVLASICASQSLRDTDPQAAQSLLECAYRQAANDNDRFSAASELARVHGLAGNHQAALPYHLVTTELRPMDIHAQLALVECHLGIATDSAYDEAFKLACQLQTMAMSNYQQRKLDHMIEQLPTAYHSVVPSV